MFNLDQPPREVRDGDSIVLLPDTTPGWCYLGVFIAAMFGGMFLLWSDAISGAIVTWLSTLVAVAMAGQVWPGMVYLRLSPKGFEFRNVNVKFFFEWNEIESFFVYGGRLKGVAFRFLSSSPQKHHAKYRVCMRLQLPRCADYCLPFCMGYDAEKLAARMNAYHARVVGKSTKATQIP